MNFNIFPNLEESSIDDTGNEITIVYDVYYLNKEGKKCSFKISAKVRYTTKGLNTGWKYTKGSHTTSREM